MSKHLNHMLDDIDRTISRIEEGLYRLQLKVKENEKVVKENGLRIAYLEGYMAASLGREYQNA